VFRRRLVQRSLQVLKQLAQRVLVVKHLVVVARCLRLADQVFVALLGLVDFVVGDHGFSSQFLALSSWFMPLSSGIFIERSDFPKPARLSSIAFRCNQVEKQERPALGEAFLDLEGLTVV